jgi:hypothetical protein
MDTALFWFLLWRKYVQCIIRRLSIHYRFTEENKAKRPEGSFVPFGMGPRMCIGMRLALLEAKMALVFMVQNFIFSTCEKTEVILTWSLSYFKFRKTNIDVRKAWKCQRVIKSYKSKGGAIQNGQMKKGLNTNNDLNHYTEN